MIRRIKALAVALPGEIADELRFNLKPGAVDDQDANDDASLEVLLKHAIAAEAAEPDAARIWHQLRRRMSGPYGRLAVEGPVQASASTTGDDEEAPFVVAGHARPYQPEPPKSSASLRSSFLRDVLHTAEAASAPR